MHVDWPPPANLYTMAAPSPLRSRVHVVVLAVTMALQLCQSGAATADATTAAGSAADGYVAMPGGVSIHGSCVHRCVIVFVLVCWCVGVFVCGLVCSCAVLSGTPTQIVFVVKKKSFPGRSMLVWVVCWRVSVFVCCLVCLACMESDRVAEFTLKQDLGMCALLDWCMRCTSRSCAAGSKSCSVVPSVIALAAARCRTCAHVAATVRWQLYDLDWLACVVRT